MLVTYQKYEITELIREIIIEWIPLFEKNNITYSIDLPPKNIIIESDSTLLRRMMNNLIKNAFKHSQATHINICLIEHDTSIDIQINDNGIGIPVHSQIEIFDRLYKVDPSRNNTGSGLGLAVVKEIIKKLEGSIVVNSAPNKGATFILTLNKKISDIDNSLAN